MSVAVLRITWAKGAAAWSGWMQAAGPCVMRRMHREAVFAFGPKLPTCMLATRACCGASHVPRPDGVMNLWRRKPLFQQAFGVNRLRPPYHCRHWGSIRVGQPSCSRIRQCVRV